MAVLTILDLFDDTVSIDVYINSDTVISIDTSYKVDAFHYNNIPITSRPQIIAFRSNAASWDDCTLTL